MTLSAEPAVPQDVYSNEPRTHAATPAHLAGKFTIHLAVENSPLSLGRVFGLVGSVSMVPELSGTVMREDGHVQVQLAFRAEDPRKIDLLCRKLGQLTETVSIRAGVETTESSDR